MTTNGMTTAAAARKPMLSSVEPMLLTTKLSEAGERAKDARLQRGRARAPRPSLQRSG